MAKQKTIPELEAEKAENERKITQLQHKKQQLENRITYYEKGDRRKRAHHLITRGAAIESVAPLTKVLTETEFYAFAEKALAGHAFHHKFQHFLRYGIIGNYALFKRTDNGNAFRNFANHIAGFVAHSQNFIFASVNCHNGRLVKHDALALDVHQKIGCTKVNAYIYTVKKHTFTYF